MNRLRSGAFGSFFVIAQVMMLEGPRAAYEKAGMWLADKEQMWGDGLLGTWDNLSDHEKRVVLAYFHETTHHIDVTSLPAGVFYWRIWDVLREYGELYIDFLRELDLSECVNGPVLRWLYTDDAKRIVSKRLATREFFGPYHLDRRGRAAVRRDYCGRLPNNVASLNNVAKHLFQDVTPEFSRYTNDLNLAAQAVHGRFLVESTLFEKLDYERVPRQEWIDCDGPHPQAHEHYFMSLLDILELRAYATELKVVREMNDIQFCGDVLARASTALSTNASAVLHTWVDKQYALQHLQYITDLALSGLIDPHCCYYSVTEFRALNRKRRKALPRIKVDFRRNWPSHRMAAILTMLADARTMLGDPSLAKPRYYTEIGQYLFGSETYPYTGLSMSQRSMIPRQFRGPMEWPLPRDGRWNAADPAPLINIVTGIPSAEWKPEIYFEELNQIFAHNQYAYLLSFCGRDCPGFVEPQTYMLKDCVVGAARSPISGDGVEAQRARRYATQSLLRHYLGAIFATALLEDEPPRIYLDQEIGRWGDAEWLSDVREQLRQVYGAPMMERFFV